VRTFDVCRAGAQLGVFVNAIQVTPAPAPLRNFRRVNFLLKVLPVPPLPTSAPIRPRLAS